MADKVGFHGGDAEIADGVTVHRIGGHSCRLQAVRVRTQAGRLVLALDASHSWENLWLRKPFPIVVDPEEMLEGSGRLQALASGKETIVPGHDPLVRRLFPTAGPTTLPDLTTARGARSGSDAGRGVRGRQRFPRGPSRGAHRHPNLQIYSRPFSMFIVAVGSRRE